MEKNLSIAVLLLILSQALGQPQAAGEKLEKWKDARFGMFIHWGPVSLKGTEVSWSRGREIPVDEYDSLYKQFNPIHFNADEWVNLARDAGMKYIVFTAKHHDGFCMWNTKYTDYNITHSPFKRDVLKELSDACKKYAMPLGIYYSTCDWHHPDFPRTGPSGKIKRKNSNLDRYTEYLKNQSVEIIKNYGPVWEMWYDVPQEFDSIRGQEVIDLLRKIQPDILVNNRTGTKGDFDTPEQKLGSFETERPWETCMTIARQWAWKPNDEVKSIEQCLQSLIRSAGGDGNLLLNVGPMSDGRIEPLQVDRLNEMGKWLKKYGQTIYGTRGGPFKPTDWGVSTRRENKIYLHVLSWFGYLPRIVLPDFGMEIRKCRLLTGGTARMSKQDGNTVIEFSGKFIQKINTIVELEVSGNAWNIQPVKVFAQSLSYGKKVTASSNPSPVWHDASSVNNGDWVGHEWQPDANDKMPWVEIDLGKPEKISKAILYESGDSVKAYVLQYKMGDEWKTLYKGERIGGKLELEFSPVESRHVRLLIKDFSGTLGIYEIILL